MLLAPTRSHAPAGPFDDDDLATQARETVIHYEHHDTGHKNRRSHILAALGRAQLSRLDNMVEIRRQHRERYAALFADIPGATVCGEPSADGATRDPIMHALTAKHIEGRPLWKLMHLQPVCSRVRVYTKGGGDQLSRIGLSLPSGSILGDEQRNAIHEHLPRLVRATHA